MGHSAVNPAIGARLRASYQQQSPSLCPDGEFAVEDGMDRRRFDEAMARISIALKRVEQAAEVLVTRPGAAGAGDEQLRARVTQTIGELDALIESLER